MIKLSNEKRRSIRDEIARATDERHKAAMFHYQVFTNARSLDGPDALDFCRKVGVPDSYTIEFKKNAGNVRRHDVRFRETE